MNNQKVCITCGKSRLKKEFRLYRKSCRHCCYLKGKDKVIIWKNGRQEYVNSTYSSWRLKHPLSRKLSILRQRGFKVKGLLPVLEQMYRESPFCVYCKIVLNINEVSLDHKTPISRGGSACDPRNWAICCKDCNYLKGGKNYSEFILFVKEYAKRFLVNTEPSSSLEETVRRSELK